MIESTARSSSSSLTRAGGVFEVGRGPSSGVWAQIDSPAVVAALASVGFDWVCLDAQHGLFDRAAVAAALRSGVAATPIVVRVSSNSAAEIGAVLDAGASGVIVPLVDTVHDARLAVASSFYPPLGSRSWGPLAGLWNAPVPTAPEANSRVACAVMIETAAALAEATSIASVPGVAMLFVGPFDLALALGLTLDELLADETEASPLTRVVAAARTAGISTGAFAGTPERGALLRRRGFDHVVVATDSGLLAAGAAAALGTPPAPGHGSY
jgi:4-hydroxy-2-oxoheptanedioate aldolase